MAPPLRLALAVASCLCWAGHANDELYDPPGDLASQPEWLKQLGQKRDAIRRQINYTGAVYLDSAVNWTRLSVVQPQTHLFDRYLYDPVAHAYTVDRYLNDVTERYGGIDSVLLWPTYTNIGIDARSQFDYFRALPEGLDGLAKLTADFKSRGVRVLWAYNPWDQGTRDEGEPHWTTMARLLKQTGGDGFNGDTMGVMYREFWDAGVRAGHRVVGEMEGGGYPTEGGRPEDASWNSAEWSPMGWGYFRAGLAKDNITYVYDVAPGIDKLKWLDGRRMTHVCDRWAKNRTDTLQLAFFNGIGYESWENVWGIFVKFTQRDGEALKRIATLLRWLSRESFVQDFASWEPYSPDLLRPAAGLLQAGGPFASRFVHNSSDCVWLVVNRASSPTSAKLDVSKCIGGRRDVKLYDLYRGLELGQSSEVTIEMEANGFGAILASSRQLPQLGELLVQMQDLTKHPLESYSSHWEPLQQEMIGAETTKRYESALAGMVLIPQTRYRFRTAGMEIEGGCDPTRDSWGVCCSHPTDGPHQPTCPKDKVCRTPCAFSGEDSRGVDVQFPWEATPGRFHDKAIEVGPFFIDKHLVTKAEYAQYLNETGYQPRDAYNFLSGWQRSIDTELGKPTAGRTPTKGEERQPVVWVSLNEARAYCSWAGKRLPHTYEWQLAAQGDDGRLYPWGNASEEAAQPPRRPVPAAGRVVPVLPDAGAFSPAGDSVHGVADLVGHVWQYTDEFRDDHTRTVILKGSSLYEPMLSSDFPARTQVGNWYFPKAPQLDRHGRMMLMDDSYERAGTLGFRCAADHAEGQPGPHHFRDLASLGDVEDSSGKPLFA